MVPLHSTVGIYSHHTRFQTQIHVQSALNERPRTHQMAA